MREVSAVWFRNTVGSQFLKVSMPKDAISLQATVKTASGIHKLTIDRWGDATHKYDNYNSRRHPTSRDQVAIKRYEADKMVMDPQPSPIPVMKKKNSTRYWPAPRQEDIERSEAGRMWHSHRHPNSRRARRSSPYYPPSPQYPGPSTPERETQSEAGSPHSQENFHDPQDPWSVHDHEIVNDVPDIISYQLDGQGTGNENPTDRPEAPHGTPPKKLKDFIESTEELNQALDDAIEIMEDQEMQAAKEPVILQMAKLMTNVNSNKVTHMDGLDTKIANPGRHRNKAEFNKAEINHVVFLEAPEAPETGKANKDPDSPQSGIIPLTPKVTKAAEKKEATNPEEKDKEAGASKIPRKRVSPCKCNQPETSTSEATSTTAGDSGSDSKDQE